jgi:hypothetical protein
MTVLDHLTKALQAAARYNRHDAAPPAVVLWTDGQRLWEPVVDRVREGFPNIFVLAPGIRDAHTGPSTWIRYQLSARDDRTTVPVVYLPGVSRQAFRSAAAFPEQARHLFALQFLGQFWTQTNGKDWTPSALLASADGGLELDLAKDTATLTALTLQLANVLETPVRNLQGKRLEAADFNSLSVGDPVGMMLRWMAEPEKAKASWPADQMAAFDQICRQQFRLDLASEGRIGAAEKLVAGGGDWETVWDRFQEAPRKYRGLRDALLLVPPKDLFGSVSLRLPQTNQTAEDRLRQDLLSLAQAPHHTVTDQLVKWAADHRGRAGSVWAALNEAPLARAVVHLGRMAQAISEGLAGSDWSGLADAYLAAGWKVDAEARHSFSTVRKKPDIEAVTAALHAAYLPWLEQQAQRMAAWNHPYPVSSPASTRHLPREPGTVYLFVDGLRTDVALELCTLLEAAGACLERHSAWAPLPTVTATAKPGWQPLAEALGGEVLPESYEPDTVDGGKRLTTEAFRSLITKLGFQWFPDGYPGEPAGTGWTETGDLDARGHEEGAKLAWRVPEVLDAIKERVFDLRRVGWKKVVILTDHGWLWMPGGLPKTELPAHLTASKWGRCAVPNPGAHHSLPTTPWFWGNHHHVVLAPGVSAFLKGQEYCHGGATIQEALTLMITVAGTDQAPVTAASIRSVRWAGLRLHVEVTDPPPDGTLDLRTKAADATSSLIDPKGEGRPLGPDGKGSLVVLNDDFAGSAATLVVLRQGEVVAKYSVTIGEN